MVHESAVAALAGRIRTTNTKQSMTGAKDVVSAIYFLQPSLVINDLPAAAVPC